VIALPLVLLAATPVAAEDGQDPLATAQSAWVANRRIEALELIATHRLDGARSYVLDGLRSLEPTVISGSLRALRNLPVEDPGEADLARSHIEHRDHGVGLEAIRTAVALDDDRAVPALMALAVGEDAQCRAAAADAVRALLPVDLPVGSERWAAWYTTDLAAAVAALDRLHAQAAAPPRDLVAALRSLSGLRNHRSMVSEMVAPYLAHKDPEVAETARQILRGMRGPVAVAILATAPAPSATRIATASAARTAAAAAAEPPAGWSLPAWVSATWAVPVGILLGLVLIVLAAGTRTGRRVRLETARLVRSASAKPGLSGKTARLVRQGGSLAGKTARLTRKLVRKITWGGG
jgi:hypothetical protein